MTDKWDARFLELARLVASWSKDPGTKAGAVLVAPDRSIMAMGYNGFARGVADAPERLNNRDIKIKLVVHCEKNAVLSAGRPVNGSTLFTWPFMSCSQCAAFVIQAGIKRAVAPYSDNPRWRDDFVLTRMQFEEAGVKLDEISDA